MVRTITMMQTTPPRLCQFFLA